MVRSFLLMNEVFNQPMTHTQIVSGGVKRGGWRGMLLQLVVIGQNLLQGGGGRR